MIFEIREPGKDPYFTNERPLLPTPWVIEHDAKSVLAMLNQLPTHAVWLNVAKGTFSESWEINHPRHQALALDTHAAMAKENPEEAKIWKLVRYSCDTDRDFLFGSLMKLR